MSISRWRQQFEKFGRYYPPDEQSVNVRLSLFLEHKKALTKKQSSLGGGITGSGAHRRNFRRSKAKIFKSLWNVDPRRRKPTKNVSRLIYRNKPDKLRDEFHGGYDKIWRDMYLRLRDKRHVVLNVEKFSFSSAPVETINKLWTIVDHAGRSPDIVLNFLDADCLDVAPYVVLAHLMRALPPVFSGGLISNDLAAVVESVGLDRPLGMGRISGDARRAKRILPFKMVSRNPPKKLGDKSHQLKPQHKEKVAGNFYKTLDSWLDAFDIELTPTAGESLINSITEALDNAERHGDIQLQGQIGDWSMAGFSRWKRCEDDELRLICSVSIVGVGTTISDSLETADQTVRARIDEYVNRWKGNRYIVGSGRRRLLRTIMAIQDGVTRVADASLHKRGGIGLLELIGLFADLGESDSEAYPTLVTIISGNSCVQAKGDYRRGTANGESSLRELWFNDQNSPAHPPSDQHAFVLPRSFPGTIITASFAIHPGFLLKQIDGQNDGEQND
jgi:hypothetical protein